MRVNPFFLFKHFQDVLGNLQLSRFVRNHTKVNVKYDSYEIFIGQADDPRFQRGGTTHE